MRWPVSPPAGRPPSNGVISNGSAPSNGRLNSYSSNSNSDQLQDLSYSSESSCQQFALHEKWRQLFDKFDSEGFGEIPWEDFLIALNSPEFVAHIDPTKRALLAAKAKESRSTSITFQDFVNVLSGKRSLSFKLAVQQRDRELWSHPPCHRQHQFPCRSYDRHDRRPYRPDEDVYHEEDEEEYYDYTSCCNVTPSAGRYGVTSGGGSGGGGPAVTFETSRLQHHQEKEADDEDVTGGQCLLTPGHRSGQGYPSTQGVLQSPSSVSGGSSRSRVPGGSSQHQRISANGRKGRVVAAAKRRPFFGKMVRAVAKEFLADERDRKYYADNYTCCPPPLFVILVTLVELGFFTYYTLSMGQITTTGPVPIDSLFIYRPDKRSEVWRFVFYMVLHAGWIHLLFNLLVQVLVGLPLEMVHGSLRIGTVYMAGVLAGSLGTSIFDTEVYLVGASGGVYALLAAHLANVLLNYHQMEFGLIRLGGVFIIASADVGFAIYDRYAAAQHGPPVSYVAHLTGALAGLTIGLLVLKNFEQKLHEQLLWWVALGVYAACTLFALLFNVFNY